MDLFVSLAINVLIEKLRSGNQDTKLKKAVLKVFREIVRAYGSDKEFLAAAKQEFK